VDALINQVHHLDIMELCQAVGENSIDMILCDLPYGVTACEWDVRIPMEPMWAAFKRIIKPRGAIVLTATNPFAAELIMSNRDWFKYEWVIEKLVPTNFLDSKHRPLGAFELALIFGETRPNYYPQMERGQGYAVKTKTFSSNYGAQAPVISINTGNDYYPRNIIKIDNKNGGGKYHPTQKPVALFEYLIRTYTQPGEVVFDPCVGSGTTAIAARNCGRQFIVGDMLDEYVQVARARLAKPYTVPMFDKPAPPPQPTQQPMFSEED